MGLLAGLQIIVKHIDELETGGPLDANGGKHFEQCKFMIGYFRNNQWL